MSEAIGYYVHHQGQGHLDRAMLLADALGSRVTLLGTGLAGRTGSHGAVDLPDDRLGTRFSGKDGMRAGSRALHYAPIGHRGVTERMAMIAGWIAAARPSLLIVDVSVEVAMLARLCSVSSLYVRLSGLRTDPPHLEAFRGAEALLAPFHARLDDPALPAWIGEKSIYAPGLCAPPKPVARQPRSILVVLGRGRARPQAGAPLATMARALPDWHIRVLGDVDAPADRPANLDLAGWVDTVAEEIAGASLVVGAAGDGLVNLVLAAGTPFLCIPEPRAFDEQRSKARALARAGVALTCANWPAAKDWPTLVERARAAYADVDHGLDDRAGVARAAASINALAAGDARASARAAA